MHAVKKKCRKSKELCNADLTLCKGQNACKKAKKSPKYCFEPLSTPIRSPDAKQAFESSIIENLWGLRETVQQPLITTTRQKTMVRCSSTMQYWMQPVKMPQNTPNVRPQEVQDNRPLC